MKNKIEYYFFWMFGSFVRLLSWRLAGKLGRRFGRIVFLLLSTRQNTAIENLKHAFPDKSDEEIRRIARGSYESLFITLFEVLWFPKLTGKKIMEICSVKNQEMIPELLQKKKGLVVISAHCSNWELGAMSSGYITDIPILIIVQKQRNDYVDAYLTRTRTMFNLSAIVMEKSPREVISTLRNNGVVGIVSDQSASAEGLFVEFFGRPASSHDGPAVFALRTGAPIITAFPLRLPDGKYVSIIELVDTENLPDDEKEKIRIITQRHVAALERFIREHPEQWLWMHRRWKHTPKAS